MTDTQLASSPTPADRSSSATALHLSREQLAIVLSGIADGIAALNPAGELIYANDTMAQLVGYASAQALVAMPMTDILNAIEICDETGHTLLPEELPGRRALRGIVEPPRTLHFRVHKTGEERWMIVTPQAVFSAGGEIELAVNILHDITDLKRVERSQSLLVQAGVLLEAPLNYETQLGNIARLIVPELADWCAIDLGTATGPLQRLVVVHVDPAKVELAQELQQRYPPSPTDQAGIYEVLRTGQAQIYPDISDVDIDHEQLALARQLGLKSAMIVPLVARGRTLGAITLVWAESGRRYGQGDLTLAKELARRAALALDNAQLYAEAQQLNTELEQRVATRTSQLEAANVRLVNEIVERRQAEEQVRILNAELEQRVAERTAQLEQLNHDLTVEIDERQKAGRTLRTLLRRMHELYRISRAIGTVRSANEVLDALLSSSYLKAASRASIAIFESPWRAEAIPEYCSLLAAWNIEPELPLFVGQRFSLEGYGFVPPYSRDEPTVIEDVRTQRALNERVRQRFERLKTRSFIIFPLVAGGECYGALSLHFQTRRAIVREDLRHLRGLVDQAAIAINTIRSLAAEAQARRDAEAADALKLKFLAMISHELRTPLTSVKGFATTLLADDVQWPPESQRDFLQTINEEADKLGELIEQLLDLSRLEAGTLRIAPKPQTVDRIINTAMAQLQTVTAQHELRLDVPADLPTIYADADRIAQVLTNLVNNAVKFAPPRTAITVSAISHDEQVQIDVTDQGPGIAPVDRARIFEPFQQLDDHAINRTEGAGLGLAICRGLVEAHGGRIWVQDRSGPGTTVSFTLPLDSGST
ncbi:MAG TPA: ATP-binding protein [Anaerolineae bacterium]|nr:ATP-binding protein [Anaerolineae bacterium]